MSDQVMPTRRHVVTTGAAATLGVAAAAALAGCAGSSGSSSGTNPPASGGALATLSSIPVGGAVAAQGSDGKPIAIAQPESGKVVAFSATCTHAGCQVAPNGKTLVCPCHGSQFDAFTGAVLQGPASAPLSSVPVKLAGSNVVAG